MIVRASARKHNMVFNVCVCVCVYGVGMWTGGVGREVYSGTCAFVYVLFFFFPLNL